MTEPTAPAPDAAMLNRCLFVIFAAFVLLLLGKSFTFGSEAGNFWYSYYAEAGAPVVGFALTSGLTLAVLLHYTLPLVERRPLLVILAWMIAALGYHYVTRSFYIVPLGSLVESDGANSFYSISLQHPPDELLRNFETLRPRLPLHGVTNMPGKTFLYYLLELFTKSPLGLGVLVIVCSNLASGLLYLAAAEWLKDRQAALLAFVLSLVVPAKVVFLPLMNTVAPAFILLPLWLWLVYLRRQGIVWLLLLGASLYLLIFFDALPLVCGLIFVGALVQRVLTGQYRLRQLWKVAVLVPVGFLVPHLSMLWLLKFDAVKNFPILVAHNTTTFNETFGRKYWAWLVHDLKEFFVGAGLLASLLFLLWIWERLGGAVASVRRRTVLPDLKALFSDPASNALACFALSLLVVDVWGINRGEITRLWLFFDFFMCYVCGHLILRRYGTATAQIVGASFAIQGAICTAMVGFMGTAP